MINKCLLDRMQVAILSQAFNCNNLCAGNILDSGLTGQDRFPINQNSASTAQTVAATIFSPSQRKICSQCPQKHSFFSDLQVDGSAIEFEVNAFHDIHLLLFLRIIPSNLFS
jgi:hypothetical protein